LLHTKQLLNFYFVRWRKCLSFNPPDKLFQVKV
jgi:hypothetical protein